MKIGFKLPLFASTELGRGFTYPELRDITLQVEEELGISHLMIQFGPDSMPALNHLVEAMNLYRQKQKGCSS